MEAHMRRFWIPALVVLLCAPAQLVVMQQPAQALTVTCVNADNRPPFNWNDRCPVSSVDKNTIFIAEFTVGELYCAQPAPRRQSHRVRVVGDYLAGGKFLIRSIGIRYLAGNFRYAYYHVRVWDGNYRDYAYQWNNNGNPIPWDGAIRGTDNTVNLVPNHGFAPPFGQRNQVLIWIKPYLYDDQQGTILEAPNCTADEFVLDFWGP
jgi:hypothetical protein